MRKPIISQSLKSSKLRRGISILLLFAACAAGAVVAYGDSSSGIRASTNAVNSVVYNPNASCYTYTEGYYFYVEPYESAYYDVMKNVDSSIKDKDDKGLRELINSSFKYRYQYAYQATSLINPRQTRGSFKYVPYEIFKKYKSALSGWMAPSSLYYEAPGNDQGADMVLDRAFSNKSKATEPFFGSDDNELGDKAFENLAKTGVYYDKLKNWVRPVDDKDKPLHDKDVSKQWKADDFDFKVLARKAVEKQDSVRSTMQKWAKDKDNYTNSLKVWSTILSVTEKNNSYSMDPNLRFREFIVYGYNSDRLEDDKTKELEVSDTTIKELSKRFDKTDGGKDYAVKQNLYNMHYLDLMLCAYTICQHDAAGSTTAKAWENAVLRYMKSMSGINDDGYKSGAMQYIYIGVGTICVGFDKNIPKGLKNSAGTSTIYASDIDLITNAYGLTYATNGETNMSVIKKSIPRPSFGLTTNKTTEENVYWINPAKYSKDKSDDVLYSTKTNNKYYHISGGKLVKGAPNYTTPKAYNNVFSRIENAIENTTYSHGSGNPGSESWFSAPILSRIFKDYRYKKGDGKDAKLEKNKTHNDESDLMVLYQARSEQNAQYKAITQSYGSDSTGQYGGGFLYAFPWMTVEDKPVKLAAYLDISSELGDKSHGQYVCVKDTDNISSANAGVYKSPTPGTINDTVNLRLRIQPVRKKKDDDENKNGRKNWQEVLKDAKKGSIKVKVEYNIKELKDNTDKGQLGSYKPASIKSSFYGKNIDTKIKYLENGGSVCKDYTVISKVDKSSGAESGYMTAKNEDAVHEAEDTAFKTAGITLNENEKKTVAYQAKITITWKDKDNKEQKAEAISNTAFVKYAAGAPDEEIPEEKEDPEPTGKYQSQQPFAYAELKEGTAVETTTLDKFTI